MTIVIIVSSRRITLSITTFYKYDIPLVTLYLVKLPSAQFIGKNDY